jgi:hypothetical protein
MGGRQSERYFSRSFSNSSSGDLVSGKGGGSRRLSHDKLILGFASHADAYQRKPTALVSVSNRIIDMI